MLGRYTLDVDPVDRGHSTVGGLGPRWYYMGSLARAVQGSLVKTASRFTSMVALMKGTLETQPQVMTRRRWVGSANRSVKDPGNS
ncbi:hypothetical protein M9H77_14312 [Catharanthus roseus]|uniref:Uncharacterized protein n=1 Tax=Catharanthus roseus TaxID=4058 RepID=A0ACC0BMX7_CATRO|nr:hypothetical protein M9H77_14312 [Catharanthus roseus]